MNLWKINIIYDIKEGQPTIKKNAYNICTYINPFKIPQTEADVI